MPHSMPGTVGHSDVPCIEAQTTRPIDGTAPQAVPIGHSGRGGTVGFRRDRIGAVHCAHDHARRGQPSRKQIAAVRLALGAIFGPTRRGPVR